VDPTHEQGLMTRVFVRWATPRTALILGLVMAVLLVAAIPLSLLTHSLSQSVPFLPAAIIGVILARQRPRNPIGWVFVALALSVFATGDSAQYALLAYRLHHPGLPLARVALALNALWIAFVLLLPLPILFFPDGSVGSRFWRWTLRVYLAMSAIVLLVLGGGGIAQAIAARHIQVDSSGGLVTAHDQGSVLQNVGAASFLLLYVAIVLSWVVRQVAGYRRSTGDRRAQLKWLMSGGLLSLVGLVLALTESDAASPVVRAIASVGFIGVAALPISIGVGVLKYRLYEVDRLISRTLSYAIVTGLLVGVYVGMIALTTRLIPLSSSVGVAASTLVAVGLFTPVRRWVQRRVDRRFNRSQYDAEAMVATFSTRLRDAVQLETVRSDLLEVVNRAVEPSQLSLWIRPMSRI
jgi:hypothetical protein